MANAAFAADRQLRRGRVRMILELDPDLVDRFNRVYPMHGAFARVMRTIITRHLDQAEKAAEKFVGDIG